MLQRINLQALSTQAARNTGIASVASPLAGFWGSRNWNAEMESHWKLKIAHSTIKKLSFLPVRGLRNTPLQRNGISCQNA